MTPILSSTLLRTQTDARLVALAGRGYVRAFEAIVERYRRPLYRWCRRLLPEARAEDAVQVAFLKAWSAIQAGEEVRDLRPWLYRIAHNAALDNARQAGYDYEELTEALRLAPAPDEDLERRWVMRETLAGVAGLPDNQREALLRTATGQSRAEIARELHVSEAAVRQLVHRARTSLRAAATALTPMPLATWLAALGAEAGAPTGQRIAELVAGAASAGTAASAVKAGTVVVAAGVLAAGPGAELRDEVARDSRAAATASPGPKGGRDGPSGAAAGVGEGGARESGDGSSGRRGGEDARDDSSGPGSGDGDRSGRRGGDGDTASSSGPGSGSGSGSGSSGSGSGSSGSGSDSSGSGSPGSDSSGSGSSGSGSDSSGSGSGFSGLESDTSGSGSSGSGSSGSGSSGSGWSGSGSSGSDSSDSGSGDEIEG